MAEGFVKPGGSMLKHDITCNLLHFFDCRRAEGFDDTKDFMDVLPILGFQFFYRVLENDYFEFGDQVTGKVFKGIRQDNKFFSDLASVRFLSGNFSRLCPIQHEYLTKFKKRYGVEQTYKNPNLESVIENRQRKNLHDYYSGSNVSASYFSGFDHCSLWGPKPFVFVSQPYGIENGEKDLRELAAHLNLAVDISSYSWYYPNVTALVVFYNPVFLTPIKV